MNSKKNHIYIESFRKEHRAQSRKIIELFSYADHEKYNLVNDAASADIILLCDVEFDKFDLVIKHQTLRKYPDKCFLLSNDDRPIQFVRGIYASAEKSLLNLRRIRSSSYTAYFDPFKNKYIDRHKEEHKHEKKYLFSFLGRNSDPLRSQILNMKFTRADIVLQDTTELFNLYIPGKTEDSIQEVYYNTLLNSKFCICPRGFGANSLRLFECMKVGVAPVIISDSWIFPIGPQWESCSLIIKSKNIHNLEKILIKNEHRFEELGRNAKSAFDEFFSEKVYFNYLIKTCRDIKRNQIIPERIRSVDKSTFMKHYFMHLVFENNSFQ